MSSVPPDPTRTVATQAEFDQAIADEVRVIEIASRPGEWILVLASDSSTVHAYNSSTVHACDSTMVTAAVGVTVYHHPGEGVSR